MGTVEIQAVMPDSMDMLVKGTVFLWILPKILHRVMRPVL